jgi:hypothetical protein
VTRISREIAPEDASGEFTGVLKMTARGADQFLQFYDRLLASLGPDGVFSEGRPFRMAYLIHQFERMIQDGVEIRCVAVPGEYHEIDTIQDHQLAERDWGEPA